MNFWYFQILVKFFHSLLFDNGRIIFFNNGIVVLRLDFFFFNFLKIFKASRKGLLCCKWRVKWWSFMMSIVQMKCSFHFFFNYLPDFRVVIDPVHWLCPSWRYGLTVYESSGYVRISSPRDVWIFMAQTWDAQTVKNSYGPAGHAIWITTCRLGMHIHV